MLKSNYYLPLGLIVFAVTMLTRYLFNLHDFFFGMGEGFSVVCILAGLAYKAGAAVKLRRAKAMLLRGQ